MKNNYRFMTLNDRRLIAGYYLNGERACDIAVKIGVHTATIYNELQRGTTGRLDENKRLEYDPDLAQQRIQEGFKRRGKRRKAATVL